jgi:hypothetical protein
MFYIGVSWMFLNSAVDPAITDSLFYSNHAGHYNLRPVSFLLECVVLRLTS